MVFQHAMKTVQAIIWPTRKVSRRKVGCSDICRSGDSLRQSPPSLLPVLPGEVRSRSAVGLGSPQSATAQPFPKALLALYVTAIIARSIRSVAAPPHSASALACTATAHRPFPFVSVYSRQLRCTFSDCDVE
ncbi:hypothetical protein J6590_004747 [Homalodisca vitripennis]|nr:hypothetical protein J6590_004747 [Homalodisca vitripennis]